MRFGGAFSTDERKSWSVGPDFDAVFEESSGRRLRAGIGGRWNVKPRLSLSGDLSGDWEHKVVDWSSNETFRRGDRSWEIGTKPAKPSDLEDDEFV